MNKLPAPAPAIASSGFTLLELMIVLIIVAVLAAIAYPAYDAYVLRSSRAAAQACLSQYANYMERYYTTNLSYAKNAAGDDNPLIADTGSLDCASAAHTGARYQYAFLTGTPTSSAYTIQAIPQGAQTRDTQCGTLWLKQDGTPGDDTGSGASASCWK